MQFTQTGNGAAMPIYEPDVKHDIASYDKENHRLLVLCANGEKRVVSYKRD